MSHHHTEGWLWHVSSLFIALIVLVTCIYGPELSECSGFCCSSKNSDRELPFSRLEEHKEAGSFPKESVFGLPYHPSESKTTLASFARKKSRSPVCILNNFSGGLTALKINHHPLLNLTALGCARHPSNDKVYLHRHKYNLVTLSGEKGSWRDLYDSVFLSQVLSKENASVILSHTTPGSAALAAWSALVKDGLLHWDQGQLFQDSEGSTWCVGNFKRADQEACASVLLCEVVKRRIGFKESDTLKFHHVFNISEERENDLRLAYGNDATVRFDNLTSAFLACTVKVLRPKIKVQQKETYEGPAEWKPWFDKMCEFMQEYGFIQ